MNRKLKAVGCNVFCGGFTLGVEQHFKVQCHLEHDDYGVRTFRLNRPHVPVHYPRERWPLHRLGEIDFLYANPPCAIVSVCGKSLMRGSDSWRSDPRTQRIRDIVGLTRKIRPRVLAIESVVQLYTRAPELLAEQATQLLQDGYSVTHLFVNTAWHGANQNRKRYFFMAHQAPLAFERLNYAPPDSVSEVLSGVPEPGWQPRLPPEHIKLWHGLGPGDGLRGAWERHNPPETWQRSANGVRGRPRMLEYRLNPDKPMGVFYGDFFWHPHEPRRLGLNEAKALCGFPADWNFPRPDHAYSELARGVMPPMANWLARQVAASLEGVHSGTPLAAPGWHHKVDLRKPPE